MGNIAEEFFDGIDECSRCKSKDLRAVITRTDIVHKNKDKCYLEDNDFMIEEVKIFCEKCDKELEI